MVSPFESEPVYVSSPVAASSRLKEALEGLKTGVSIMPLRSNWLLNEFWTATFWAAFTIVGSFMPL